MKPPAFHILLALADGPHHGSAIAAAVAAESGGAVTLWPVTLYGTLSELEDAGLIAALGAGEHPAGASERRRYYRLTAAGRAALAAEARRLASLAATAQARIRPRRAT